MALTMEQALQQAVAAHKKGNLQEAERLYQYILQSQPANPDANHNLGVLAVSLNQIESALPLFKTALETNPNIEQFWLSYIDALIKSKQIDRAKQTIKKAKKKGFDAKNLGSLLSQSKVKANSKEPSQEQLGRLLAHYQNSRLSEAEKLAVIITQEFPQHPFGWKIFGAVLGQMGRTLEALDANQKVVALSPEDAGAHSNLGVTLQGLGRLEEAETAYRQAIALKPDFAEVFSNLGITLKELGRLEEAEAVYRQGILLKPSYAEAHSNLANTLRALGRMEEAEASYSQAIVLKPENAEAHSDLGNTLRELGRLEEAEAAYGQAIALKSDFAEAHSNLGNTLRELGRLEEAEAAYGQAIALKSEFAEAHSNLGITLKELGRLDEAEACLRKAIVLKPDYAEAYGNLGTILKELGRLKESEARLTQAIKLRPDFPEAHSNLGVALQELGRLKESVVSLTQAIRLKPDYAEAHSNLGITYKELGELKEAEASLTKAIGLKPDFAEAHSNLGITLKELGKLKEAEASLTKAIALKANFSGAHYNLGVLFFESKKYSLAAKHFELTNNQNSKLFEIKCSFLEDEKTIFDEKFDFLVSQGEINAVMGSLAFRSEFKDGLKKANPFCTDPFSYVVKSDLTRLYDFENVFVETARDILSDKSVLYRAQGHLTNGIQTAGNIFAQGKVPKTEIEKIIHSEIEKYRIQFKDSDEGFIKSWPTSYEIKGWLVCMKSGGKLAPHMHDKGWITGSIYINVPPKSEANSGNLVLCLGDGEHPLGAEESQQSQQSTINVVTGSLCLFPSSLHHYTVPFEEEEERIVLAFDVVPKDKIIKRYSV